MVWFDKSEGFGPQAVNVRDGKLTKRGERLLHNLQSMKATRGRLTFHQDTRLEELISVQKDVVGTQAPTALPGAGLSPRGCTTSAR